MDYDKDKDELKEQIAIAKATLSPETREAIDSVDWKSVVVSMRESKKFSFSQIETLGIKTEKVLVGLISGEGYKRELKDKMDLPPDELNKLISEMNDKVFKKIKENLVAKLGEQRNTTEVKTLEIQKTPKLPNVEISSDETKVFETAGINLDKKPEVDDKWAEGLEAPSEMIAQIENTDLISKKATPILEQKLTSHFQMPKVETKYQVKPESSAQKPKVEPVVKPTIPKVDPYRMSVDEE